MLRPTYSCLQDPGVEGKDQIFHQALSLAPCAGRQCGSLPNTGKNFEYFWSSSTNSPYGKLTYNKGTNKRYRTLGTIYAELQIVKGLNFKSSFNLDNVDNIGTTYVPYINRRKSPRGYECKRNCDFHTKQQPKNI